MHVITVKGMKDEGAYAVINPYGEKVVFMFKEKDDAARYAMLLDCLLYTSPSPRDPL